MAKYDIKFSCGHAETRQLYGKTRDRENTISWLEGQLCSDCWKAEEARKREEATAQAKEAAQEMELPELTGTEKQINWAICLRDNWLAIANEILARQINIWTPVINRHPERKGEAEGKIALLQRTINTIITQQTTARYWIDNRERNVENTLTLWAEKIQQEDQSEALQAVPAEVEAKAKEELTMRPETPTTSLVTDITIKDTAVSAKLPEKDEKFREIVKSMGYKWTDGKWKKNINLKTGAAVERAAELGIKLLAAGYPIRVYSDEVKDKIQVGDYQPETDRWIVHITHFGQFGIEWGRDEDFYREFKRLPGATYNREHRVMLVPKDAFREVRDFADRYKFNLSPGAQTLIQEAEQAFAEAMVMDVTPKVKEQLPQPGDVPPELEIETGEIHADLRDDN